MKYMTTKEIVSETQVFRNIYLRDLVFIGAGLLATLLLKDLVSAGLRAAFIIFSILILLILVLPSRTNPKRRNWQAVALALVRTDYIYISREEQTDEEEEEASGKRYRKADSRHRL